MKDSENKKESLWQRKIKKTEEKQRKKDKLMWQERRVIRKIKS